ncbi:MAG: Asp-tRNA(Asn)/Glu-tRNA(Gln) amidotransferase subunit GatC [Candidatus Wildermuthbacteria bacterium]|nr:Asp-tRNA(Asn)/Glu-tRNA(Gln) amidotransferase subunit GatC [Candidatus Wildermuthbacteria bacterium]
MISPKEVQHIAKLARIELTDRELIQFQKELAGVLAYFEILQEVNVSSVAPMTHSVLLENVYRSDEFKAKTDDIAQKLLQMAPETKNGYLKVKQIL